MTAPLIGTFNSPTTPSMVFKFLSDEVMVKEYTNVKRIKAEKNVWKLQIAL